jgi:O-antigen/teichoic acid export membrane protein
MLKKLAQHSTNYSLGSLLVMLSGFVSFPIFTRVFSVEEYGILNLVSATLPLLTGIAKLGVQNSIVRFYAEARASRDGLGLRQFRSTTLLGMLAASVVVTLVWVIVSQAIPIAYWSDPRVSRLLLITSVLVIVKTADSCLTNFVRAEERSALFGVYAVARRYLGLAAVLLTLFYVARNLYGFYAATIATEAGAVVFLFAYLGHTGDYSPRFFSPALFRKMLAFGVPLIAFELAGITLNVGDRYVVEALLGSGPLGTYSAGYNFCEYVRLILFASVVQAIMPMYINSWEQRGQADTCRFVSEALHYYLMLALPVIAGMSAVGSDLLVLLASDKYRQSAMVIPWVTAGMAIDSMVVILGAGLFIHKRTLLVAGLVTVCATLNVALNLLLVPRHGILGSAVATLVSYAALGVSVHRASARTMPVPFPSLAALKFTALAVLMYVAVVSLPFGSGMLPLAARIAAGVLLYATMVAATDEPARAALRAARVQLRRDQRD